MKNFKQRVKTAPQNSQTAQVNTQVSPIMKSKNILKIEKKVSQLESFMPMSFIKKNSLQLLQPLIQTAANQNQIQKSNSSTNILQNLNARKKLIRTELRRNSNKPNQMYLQKIKNKIKKMKAILQIHKRQTEFGRQQITNMISKWKIQNLNDTKQIKNIIQLNNQIIQNLKEKNERLQLSLNEMQSGKIKVNQKVTRMKQLIKQKEVLFDRKCEELKEAKNEIQFLKGQVQQTNDRMNLWKVQVKNISQKQSIKQNQLSFKELEVNLMKEELMNREINLKNRERQIDELKNQYQNRLLKLDNKQPGMKTSFVNSCKPLTVTKQKKYQKYYKIISAQNLNKPKQNGNIVSIRKLIYSKKSFDNPIKQESQNNILKRAKSVPDISNSYLRNEPNTTSLEKQTDQKSSISKNRKTPKLSLRINNLRRQLTKQLDQIRQNTPLGIPSLKSC